ncbi:MAG: hypothetical protein AAFX06_14490 [Planctomycetota bacterium]
MQLLHPCPGCGAAMHFPAMPSIESVTEELLEHSDGKCPLCGTMAVVETAPPPRSSASAAVTRDSRIIELPLSIRCRAKLHRLGLQTLGEAFNRDQHSLFALLGPHAAEFLSLVDRLDRDREQG